MACQAVGTHPRIGEIEMWLVRTEWDPILVARFFLTHFGLFRCTTHFRLPTLVVGLGPVHWGLTDLAFEKPMAM